MRRHFIVHSGTILLLLLLVSCGAPSSGSGATTALPTQPPTTPAPTSAPTTAPAPTAVPFQMTSASFTEGQPIPVQYTCDGDDTSPPLSWTGAPSETQSFVLLLRDPDADNYSHWVVYNLPPSVTALEDSQAQEEELSNGGKQGMNDNRDVGYGGPCPPKGETHRYVFTLYALDTVLELDKRILKLGAPMLAIEIAMKGHILAETRLSGAYQRPT